jgi:hypothetical protein
MMLLAVACNNRSGSGANSGEVDTGSEREWFSERAREAGLEFTHFNGMSGEFYYPEMFAPGVGLIDIDNDDDLDVYVTQGQMLGPGKTIADAVMPPRGTLNDRLFRNDLTVAADGLRTLRFTDITEASGIDMRTFGMGVAAGDFDNDGWVDIYRTGTAGGVLLRNNRNGTFADVTIASGTANAGAWGVSAAFVDYDRDGWLDLFVGNYVDYRIERDVDCLSVTGQRDYCPPQKYPAQLDRLYRNRGNGTFEDVTRRALTVGADGPALGVSTADFNGDGWIDVYVGNDGTPNQLWINQRDGTFRDTAFVAGAAVNGAGAAEASMGIDAGDFDNDGDEDLFVTNWLSQMNILYVNAGGGVFQDRKAASGLGAPSLAKTGFATAWLDYDNDGWLDLLTANGSVSTIEAQARARDPFPFRMTNQLYRNTGSGRFEDVSAQAGAPFASMEVSRGAAFGDVDNDGDTDVIIGNDAGPLELLINNIGNRSHWIGLRLVGSGGPQGPPLRGDAGRIGAPHGPPARDMLGARVQIVKGDGSTLWRRARADGSYASANDPRVLVGLGADARPLRVRVEWPDGTSEQWNDLPVDSWLMLRQGTGSAR